jgi:hypothetical protein
MVEMNNVSEFFFRIHISKFVIYHSMEFFQKKEENRATTSFAAMFLAGLLTFSIVAALSYIPTTMAKTTPVKIGNPHYFRPGPPIPSCNAEFHQGPPGDDIKGCRGSPDPDP